MFSPAKLNLFFRVLHRRDDGFHEIASLYQAISLGDKLTVSLAEEDRLTCDDPSLPCDNSNLILKALAVFREQTGYHFPVHAHLEKRIPVQAGLGGGSGNAATMIWALNVLAPQAAPVEEMARWAGRFSSDAPFFFSNGTAYCTGRGERIQNIEGMAPAAVWIAKPQEGLSTPLVYGQCRPSEFLQRDPKTLLRELLSGKPSYVNDLEIPAFALQPRLARLKEELKEMGFSHVAMTGSGTAFFCLGNCQNPYLPGVKFYPAAFHFRSTGSWYEFPEV